MSEWGKTNFGIKYEFHEDVIFVKDSYRILNQDEGVDFIVGKTLSKPEGPFVLKEVLFDTEFNEDQAKVWVKEHKKVLDAFSSELFETSITMKAENLLVELKELDEMTLKLAENDELEAIHALLHAMHFREKAGMSTEGWNAGRIQAYHSAIVETMKVKQMGHYQMSDLDDGVPVDKALTEAETGDVLTRPDIGEHKFRSVMTATAQAHAHCVTVGPNGSGFTSAQKGHSHLAEGNKVLSEAGHTHALTSVPCTLEQAKWILDTDAETVKMFVLRSLGFKFENS